MTVRLEIGLGGIRIVDRKGKLSPAIKSTLRLRGFSRRDDVLAAEHSEQEDPAGVSARHLARCWSTGRA